MQTRCPNVLMPQTFTMSNYASTCYRAGGQRQVGSSLSCKGAQQPCSTSRTCWASTQRDAPTHLTTPSWCVNDHSCSKHRQTCFCNSGITQRQPLQTKLTLQAEPSQKSHALLLDRQLLTVSSLVKPKQGSISLPASRSQHQLAAFADKDGISHLTHSFDLQAA